MVFRFETRAGRRFIERNDYTLADEEGDTVEEGSWETAIIPGSIFFMAAIVKKAQTPDRPLIAAVCPKCATDNARGTAGRVIQW